MKIELFHPELGSATISWAKKKPVVETGDQEWQAALQELADGFQTNGALLTRRVVNRQHRHLRFDQFPVLPNDADFPLAFEQSVKSIWPDIETSLPVDEKSRVKLGRAQLLSLVHEMRLVAPENPALISLEKNIQAADAKSIEQILRAQKETTKT